MEGSRILIACAGGSLFGAMIGTLFFDQPHNAQYGSYWHAFQHKFGQIQGRIGHVQCVDYSGEEPRLIKTFGLVCESCGYVNVNRILSEDDLVQNEICGRSTMGFTWTKKN